MAGPEIGFLFQFGTIREIVTTNANSLTFSKLKELACDFINTKVSYFRWLPTTFPRQRRVFHIYVSFHMLSFPSVTVITFDDTSSSILHSTLSFQFVVNENWFSSMLGNWNCLEANIHSDFNWNTWKPLNVSMKILFRHFVIRKH